LNNIVTLKYKLRVNQLKVIENDTIRKLGYGFPFAFHSNVPVCCIISEIKRDIGRKWRCFHSTVAFDVPVRESPSEYYDIVWYG